MCFCEASSLPCSGSLRPARFLRWHPKQNVVYGCTESVKENGQIVAWKLNPKNGSPRPFEGVDVLS